ADGCGSSGWFGHMLHESVQGKLRTMSRAEHANSHWRHAGWLSRQDVSVTWSGPPISANCETDPRAGSPLLRHGRTRFGAAPLGRKVEHVMERIESVVVRSNGTHARRRYLTRALITLGAAVIGSLPWAAAAQTASVCGPEVKAEVAKALSGATGASDTEKLAL